MGDNPAPLNVSHSPLQEKLISGLDGAAVLTDKDVAAGSMLLGLNF